MEINILKKKKCVKKFKKESFKNNSNFFWKLILGIFSVLVISSFVFGYILFIQNSKDISGSEYVNNGNKLEVEKEQKIQKELNLYSDREKASLDIINSIDHSYDPSL